MIALIADLIAGALSRPLLRLAHVGAANAGVIENPVAIAPSTSVALDRADQCNRMLPLTFVLTTFRQFGTHFSNAIAALTLTLLPALCILDNGTLSPFYLRMKQSFRSN
jgi:hypothetical protein